MARTRVVSHADVLLNAWRSGYLRTIGGNCQDESIRHLQEGIPPQRLSWKRELESGMDLSFCFCLFFNICRLSSHTQKRLWELRFHWPKGRQLNQCCLWSVKIQELFSFFSRPPLGIWKSPVRSPVHIFHLSLLAVNLLMPKFSIIVPVRFLWSAYFYAHMQFVPRRFKGLSVLLTSFKDLYWKYLKKTRLNSGNQKNPVYCYRLPHSLICWRPNSQVHTFKVLKAASRWDF